MPRLSIALILVSMAGGAFVQPARAQQAADATLIARGEYLAKAADCMPCHTTEGGRPYAGGRAFALPFGNLYAPNITPDEETGIGRWTDDDFVRAMHEGVGRGGRHLYPAFPYTAYTLMSREDALAIKAYLFSLPPVRSERHDDDLAFPFNQRWAMRFWNLLFHENRRFEPDPGQSAEWNRGAYLVEALGHCGECHTPRNAFQARDESRKFAGAVLQGWKAYNITADAQSGLGNWSDAQLSQYLATGRADGRSVASGPMAEVVEHSLRWLTREDIRAMVVYLRSVAAIRNEPPIATSPPATKAAGAHALAQERGRIGAQLFASACASCHRWDGQGSHSPYAALLGTQAVNEPEANNLTQVILLGSRMHGPRGEVFMPGFGSGYSDADIAALVNFTAEWFGGRSPAITPERVGERRAPTVQLFPTWLLWVAGIVALLILVGLIAAVVALVRRSRRRREAVA